MYNPAIFASSSDAQIEEIIAAHPFATLITAQGTESVVSHLPLVLEKRSSGWVLIGHVARANPHWKILEGYETLAIFHGPQAYITPLFYQQCDVPTWNYVVAHLKGVPRLLTTEADTIRALEVLSLKMEGKDGWEFSIPEDLARPGVLMKSIIAFEIPVTTMSAKLKLSQNRSPADFAGVLRGLSQRQDEQSKEVFHWMQRLPKRKE